MIQCGMSSNQTLIAKLRKELCKIGVSGEIRDKIIRILQGNVPDRLSIKWGFGKTRLFTKGLWLHAIEKKL